MASRVALSEIRSRTYKQRDAWWTVWLVDPLASRLVWLVSPWRWITPNLLTIAAFLVGLGSAAAFWQARQGGYGWLLLGAILFHLSFVLDCMDGKIARLNGTGSMFGAWLDYVFDRLRVAACAVAMFGGQYERTHDFAYVWLAGLVLFLDMFRYLNALEMGKIKTDMRVRLAELDGPSPAEPVSPAPAPAPISSAPVSSAPFSAASGSAGPFSAAPVSSAPFSAASGSAGPLAAGRAADGAVPAAAVDTSIPVEDADFRAQFSGYLRVRNFLVGNRIRPHLFSGIEFMMFVFILGPVLNRIVGMTLLSAALMIGFELMLIFKLWKGTRSYARRMAAAPVVPAQLAVDDEVTAGVP